MQIDLEPDEQLDGESTGKVRENSSNYNTGRQYEELQIVKDYK